MTVNCFQQENVVQERKQKLDGLRDQRDRYDSANGLRGLARVTGGACTRTGLGMMVSWLCRKMSLFSEKHICVLGKTSCFKIFHLKNEAMEKC